MMRLRKLLVITLLFLTASDVCGQTIAFSTNAPRSGDAIKKKQVEYFNPGNSGNNVLWDFRDIELDGEERYTKFFDGPDTLLWSTKITGTNRPHDLTIPLTIHHTMVAFGRYSSRMVVDFIE